MGIARGINFARRFPFRTLTPSNANFSTSDLAQVTQHFASFRGSSSMRGVTEQPQIERGGRSDKPSCSYVARSGVICGSSACSVRRASFYILNIIFLNCGRERAYKLTQQFHSRRVLRRRQE